MQGKSWIAVNAMAFSRILHHHNLPRTRSAMSYANVAVFFASEAFAQARKTAESASIRISELSHGMLESWPFSQMECLTTPLDDVNFAAPCGCPAIYEPAYNEWSQRTKYWHVHLGISRQWQRGNALHRAFGPGRMLPAFCERGLSGKREADTSYMLPDLY